MTSTPPPVDPADAVMDIYERHASTWDTLRGRQLFEKAWLDRFIACLPEGGSVLDIGCGAGEPISAYLIGRGFELTGIDSSKAMIDRCRQRFPASTFHVADMRGLSLRRRFDGLIAWDSSFHLTRDDQRALFDVLKLHAAPRAALLFTSGPADGVAIGEFEGEPLYHVSLAPDEYRRLLDAGGFDVLAMTANDPECGGHTVWLAQRR